MSRFRRIALLALIALAGAADSALASSVFDGRWSVLIITDKGNCDRAYRYRIDIRDGQIFYEGEVVDFRGRVAGNGAVRVTVSRGNQHASGSGRLGRDSGTGYWSGSGNGTCSGRWEADRR